MTNFPGRPLHKKPLLYFSILSHRQVGKDVKYSRFQRFSVEKFHNAFWCVSINLRYFPRHSLCVEKHSSYKKYEIRTSWNMTIVVSELHQLCSAATHCIQLKNNSNEIIIKIPRDYYSSGSKATATSIVVAGRLQWDFLRVGLV